MALSVIKLANIRDSFELNFDLPDKELWKVICPSPVIADATRRRLSNHSLPTECLTISKFLGDFYGELGSEKEVTRKSELLRILATVWRLKFSEEPTYFFEQAFELFTDLRSFTLNPQLIESLLSHYDPIIANAVRYFWLVVEGQEIIDEHLAYHLILEGIDSGVIAIDSALKGKGLVFQGFTHLSGSQIDLLKALGRFSDVIIPIPQEVIKESVKTDWVDWISTQADTIVEHVKGDEVISECSQIVEFERLSLNDVLANVMGSDEGDLLVVKNNLSFQNVLTINKRDFFFKTELNFFKGISRDYQNQMDKILSQDGEAKSTSILSYLEGKLENILKGSRNFQVFVEIKFLKILIKEIEQWCSLSSENELIDRFSLKIIWEILTLNLPRTYNIPLLKDGTSKILTLKELPEVDTEKKTIVVVDEGHDLKGSGASSYSKEVSEILYTLGPVRRKGLDISFYKVQLKEVLLAKTSVLLIEKGLAGHDKLWSNLVSELRSKGAVDINLELQSKERQGVPNSSFSIIDHRPAQSISASRLQTYLDCPRKYYYSYILKMGNEPPRHSSVDPRLLGNFEHEIVQRYLSQSRIWDGPLFESIIDEIVKMPVSLQQSMVLHEETIAEVKCYSKVMIEELLKLVVKDPDCTFEFESPMKGAGAIGFADIYIKSKEFGRMLFDLKRSASSVPQKNEVLNLSSIQLWYYMEFVENKREYFDVYGFLNFSDPSSSLLFFNNEDSAAALTELDFLNIEKMHPTHEEFDQTQYDFLELYKDVKDKINSKDEFPISPKNSSVCHFCPGNIICSREVTNEAK